MRTASATTVSVEHIFISAGHNFFGHYGAPAGNYPAVEVESIECVAGWGLRGDRFFGYRPEYKGQVTLFSLEVFDAFCTEFGLQDISPAAVRRNVFLRGVDLDELIGTTFTLQGVGLEGVDECRPCVWMNEALAPGAEEWLSGRGGLRCRVRSTGWLCRGMAPLQGITAAANPARRFRPAARLQDDSNSQIAVRPPG